MQVSCLNESAEGACKHIFKPWEQRTDFSGPSLRSNDGDAELLLHIPYVAITLVDYIPYIPVNFIKQVPQVSKRYPR